MIRRKLQIIENKVKKKSADADEHNSRSLLFQISINTNYMKFRTSLRRSAILFIFFRVCIYEDISVWMVFWFFFAVDILIAKRKLYEHKVLLPCSQRYRCVLARHSAGSSHAGKNDNKCLERLFLSVRWRILTKTM